MYTTLQKFLQEIFLEFFCLFNFHILIVIKSHNLTIRLTNLPRKGRPTVGHPARRRMPNIDPLIVFAICDLSPIISNYILAI